MKPKYARRLKQMVIKLLFYVLACYIIRKQIVFELIGTFWAVQLYNVYF